MAEEAVVILSNGRRLRQARLVATVQVDADAVWCLDDGSEGISRYIDTYLWLDGRWQVI